MGTKANQKKPRLFRETKLQKYFFNITEMQENMTFFKVGQHPIIRNILKRKKIYQKLKHDNRKWNISKFCNIG